MAGAFTHMAILDEAVSKFPATKKIGKIFLKRSNYLTLGCVSPDVPYLAPLNRGPFWANIFHYEKTNGVVQNGLHSLAVAKEKSDAWECQLAWLMGFVSHLVADATIHPIVEAMVGPYSDQESNRLHGHCEMIQDVLIFKEVKNIEVAAGEYTNLLRDCSNHSEFRKVIEFWDSHAFMNYPSAPKMSGADFVDKFISLLDLAEGGGSLAKAFRHLGVELIYRTEADLRKNYANEVKNYYENICLPTGLRGSFRINGFDYAVKNTVDVLSRIDRSLFTTDNVITIIPNWNLDTGVDQVSGVRTYWS
jgi:hypothetical protein